MSIHCSSAILIKRGVLISVSSLKDTCSDTVHISLIDIVINIALKSVKFH